MNYRKWMLGLLVVMLCLPVWSTGARAAAAQITIELDGVSLSSDVPPYITRTNVTMVPAGVISKGLGAGVIWDQASKTATISKGNDVLKLTSGSKTAVVNDARVSLDTSVQITQGRVMVPLRFVSEQLGLQVVWNQATKHVALYSNAEIGGPSAPAVPTVPTVPAPTVPTPDVTAPAVPVPTVPSIPGVKAGKAMKGAWVSTVYNLDWPSTASAGNADKQKKEFDSLLDKLQAAGFNSVFVQVRPSADALYPSQLVPWSKVLTGTEGKQPGYDPLDYMVSAAHSRGMQFHAWFNPFRAATAADTKGLAENHVAKLHPEWIVKADNKLYINPGIPEARQHIIDTVMEVVRGYDIDGVHLDDYFYPSGVTFADDAAFKTYNATAITSKGDWRRDNINQFISRLGNEIHAVKPAVSYGVSPFGVWRNKKADSTGSDTTAGVSAYDDMYADVRAWIQNGWVDYVAPQIYWSLSFSAARYDKLVDWWVNEVSGTGVKLYTGLASYKVGDTKQTAEWQSAEQIINQLKYNEQYDAVSGSILFRANDIVARDPFGLAGLLSFYFKS
ncbi:family 10 glycosylhydrolase [Paenibacillus sp. MMS20-IR301]|uniref:family 10 glycosylhydrolase n=1 Tax=Paenibacillus sp. MMS20-IR301 TaxID=2895946 RepID=UPI0028E2355F|nr:family 10 glycosylhydrolase [Paenibacillus sp. MMS20-IR301]WNS44327.1 family 10 glycosylhydrolase [Paenibacillus sp. MMS20-IR301]